MEDEHEETALEKMHDSGQGTQDPNIADDETPRILPVDPEHSEKLLP
jgi:hypothetical protein